MAIYSLASLQAFPTTAAWYYCFQHAQNPAIGYKMTCPLSVNIHALGTIVEGTACPAWYPSNVADVVGGTATYTSAGSRNFYRLDASGEYVEWTVTSDGNGADTLLIYHVDTEAGGTAAVAKNVGLPSEAALGTLTADSGVGGGTTYDNIETISSISPVLATGDKIRITYATGSARVQNIIAYNSAGTCTYHGQPFALPASDQISSTTGSSIEFAYSICPTGSAKKWIGGVAHQAIATYCTEVSNVDAWTVNGTSWTPAPGWESGMALLHRTSDVDYNDAGHTILGSLDYTLYFADKFFGCQHKFTCAVEVDFNTLYPCMMAANNTLTKCRFLPGGSDFTITADDDSNVDATAAEVARLHGACLSTTPAGAFWHVELSQFSHAASASFAKQSADPRKWYVSFAPSHPQAAGGTWGGRWFQSFRKSAISPLRLEQRERRALLLP